MSLETLLEAAKYLEYQSNAASRGEIPKDYTSFASCASPGDDSGPLPVFPSSSDASTGDNSYTFTDDSRERRDIRERQKVALSGIREVHNKLEKNRRAHLKKCFETLKKQLPNLEDKKTSNLSILRSALRYIEVLHRKENDCLKDKERLKDDHAFKTERLRALREKRVSPKPERIDEDSNSTSTASECGPLSDVEEEKTVVFSKPSASVTAPSILKTEASIGYSMIAAVPSTIAVPPPQKMLVPATTVGHVFGRTLAPHPPVLTASAGSVVPAVAVSHGGGHAATLTFTQLPPRLQLAPVGFPAQGFHHGSLNGGPTLLPAVQVLTTQQGTPVRRLIATPLGAVAPGVTLTVGPTTVATTTTTHLAYASRTGAVLTAAQQQLPVTATLASMGGGSTGSAAGSPRLAGVGVTNRTPAPPPPLAFAQVATKPENSAFAALTAAAALSFQSATVTAAAPTTAIVSPPGLAVTTTTATTSNGFALRHLVTAASSVARPIVPISSGTPLTSVIVPSLNHNTATNNHRHSQPQIGKMVATAPAGFLQQFLPQLSGVKPLVVVSAAPTLAAVAPAQTIVAQSQITLPVSR